MRSRAWLLIVLLPGLIGCEMVQDLAEAQHKSEAVALALEKEVGAKPVVGCNIRNGTLTNVTVTFPLERVSDLAVGELEAKVRAAVLRGFDKPPEQLTVSVYSNQK